MRFSWKWLNELIDLRKIPIKQIEETLTLAGLEVENIEHQPEIEDHILNINITANRSDVCSMVGLAKEISILFNIPLNKSIYERHQLKSIDDTDTYSHFQSQNLLQFRLNHLKLARQNPSPIWLKNHLYSCGIESTNILSDICEYINLKWGQDIEILDLGNDNINNVDLEVINESKLNNKYIDQSVLYNLLDFKKNYNTTDLEMITYRNSILSIFGIRSNSAFFCNDKSTSIIIIGQVCKKEYIERIAPLLKNKTTRINQQLKIITNNEFHHAYHETINLIISLNTCKIGTLNYNHNNINYNNTIIKIHEKLIKNVLGPYKDIHNTKTFHNTVHQIFKQLNFNTTYSKGIFTVTIPEYRFSDIQRDIDIIEEIARIYGFDQFIDHLPKYTRSGYISDNSKIIKKTRYILRNLGLHEIVHHSLEQYSTNKINEISIYNPLLEEQSQLKHYLIGELISALIYNKKQKNLPFEAFEIGRVFCSTTTNNNTIQYQEEIRLAGILGNPKFARTSWAEQNQELTWFQAKGLLEELFEKLSAKVDWIHVKNCINNTNHYYNPYIYHPYRTAILRNKYTKEIIGVFGQLNPKIKYTVNNQHNQYIFEINIQDLINTISKNTHLYYNINNYSVYPSVIRDISLIIPENTTVESVITQILNYNNKLVESVEVFNEYKKKCINSENRYVGFRITYRSKYRTLNDEDINKIDTDVNYLLKMKL